MECECGFRLTRIPVLVPVTQTVDLRGSWEFDLQGSVLI
jgi:hypothetical protein